METRSEGTPHPHWNRGGRKRRDTEKEKLKQRINRMLSENGFKAGDNRKPKK